MTSVPCGGCEVVQSVTCDEYAQCKHCEERDATPGARPSDAESPADAAAEWLIRASQAMLEDARRQAGDPDQLRRDYEETYQEPMPDGYYG